jgi:hypothetical protein
MLFRHVLLFGVAEGPYLVTLDTLAGKIAESPVLIYPTSKTDINQQLCHGVDRAISHAGNRSHAVTLNQHADYLRSLFNTKFVHDLCPLSIFDLHISYHA